MSTVLNSMAVSCDGLRPSWRGWGSSGHLMDMHGYRLGPGLLLSSLAGALACASGDNSAVAIERSDSAGVAIVLSRGADVPLDWRIEPRLTIGSMEGGPEAFGWVSSRAVAVDPEGRIVVLDGGNHRVVVFDSMGRHLTTFAKKGGGPGELEYPSFLTLDREGNAVVADLSKRDLVRYALDGSLLASVSRPDGPSLQHVRFTSEGMAFSRRENGPDQTPYTSVYRLRDSIPELITRLEREPVTMVTYERCRVGMALGPLFDPVPLWDADDDRLIVSTAEGYVIDVFEGTRLVASLRRDVPPTPTTIEMARREIGEDGMRVAFAGGECTIPVEEVIEKRGMAPTLPALDRLAIAPDGTVWVARGAVRGDTALVDVLASTGEYQGTLARGTPFPAAFFPNGDIVAVETDELDVPRLVVYRVVRGDDAP